MRTLTAPVQRVFDWKVRGVRWVEIVGCVLVAVMILSVYVAKAGAAREGSRIAELEREIADNRQRVRLLNAEAARLEQPARLEALSREAGLAPVAVKQVTDAHGLVELAPEAEPAPVMAAAIPATTAPAPLPAEAVQ
jgi:hypothetical protein